MSDELSKKTQEEETTTTAENAEAVETTEAETEAITAEKAEQAVQERSEAETAEEEIAVAKKTAIPTFTGEKSAKVYTLDELEEASEDYSDDEFHNLMQMYEGTLTSITEKEIVSGRVVSVDEKYVVVDIGFKSEGIVPVNEFKNIDEVKPGDEIEVFLDRVEDREGQLVLSRRKANTLRVWQKIEEVHEKQEVIEGHIKRRIKGGMVVDIFGIDAFLPGSQIDVRPVRDFDAYVGRNMEFLVVKLNMSSENVVVSHRALVETDLEDQRQEILSSMQAGQILEGIVKNITDFGVFIDLGGVDGLLHITDLSWGRVEHPSEICKLDQRLNVVVLEFDEERKRISLGLKQLQPHPWDEIDKKYPENTKVQGKVVSIADYGAFIELEKGVEGLVHISEMSWTQHIKHPSQLVEKNQVIECVILNINKNERKVSLGVKQLENDPWQDIIERYPINSRHQGVVRNLTNFGVFVELEPGIDGLVHISDLSWVEKVNHPSEIVNKGDEIEVSILSVDFDNRRISLGHKQITDNPWKRFAEEFQLGAEIEGTVTRHTEKGAFVKLPHGLEGFLPVNEVDEQKEFKTNFKTDTEVKLSIVEFDEQSRHIKLSEKESTRKSAEKELKKLQKKREAGEQPTGALTLGEMSGLSDLKKQLDDEDKAPAEKKPAAANKAKAKAKSDDFDDAEADADAEEKATTKAKANKKAEADANTEVAAKAEKKADADAKPKAEASSEEKAETSEKSEDEK